MSKMNMMKKTTSKYESENEYNGNMQVIGTRSIRWRTQTYKKLPEQQQYYTGRDNKSKLLLLGSMLSYRNMLPHGKHVIPR